jgi:hypothetical protein
MAAKLAHTVADRKNDRKDKKRLVFVAQLDNGKPHSNTKATAAS